jgi:hypothetical protein
VKAYRRYLSQEIVPMWTRFVPLKLKSKKHIEFIRDLPCIITGKPNPDPHHVLRKSQGLNDYLTVPLCHELHHELHNIGVKSFSEKYNIDFKDALIAKLVERIYELEGEK